MGQLVIEVPQNINLRINVKSAEIVDEILELVKEPKKKKSGKMSAIIPPRRNSLKEDGDAVLGIWADNEEEADEIARKIRDANRRTT